MKRFCLVRQARAASHCVGLFLAAWCFCSAPLVGADTPEFSAEPFLRLNPDAHTAPIRRISVDKRGRFVVTGSVDKTVRVRALETGRLEQVLRVPLGDGNVGKVQAVALSPDATQVAVSGWTGVRVGDHAIYIFDRQSGRLEHRIKDLPNVIYHLTYSTDGRYLAAMIWGGNGLRVYETSRYGERAKDSDYDDDAYWADFDESGRLVTSSYDGDIRLYGADAYSKPRVRRAAPAAGKRPFGVAFSPDGQSIALGYYDSTRIDVLSAKTLKRVYSPNTERFRNGNLMTVAWSPDGRYLFASGRYSESGYHPVIRWSQAGRGDFVKYALAEDTVMHINPFADGRLVIGASDPLVALLDASGNAKWSKASEQADFRSQEGHGDPGLQLSRTGDVVEFGFEFSGEQRARFDLKATRLDLEPSVDAPLMSPTLDAPGLNVTDWNDGDHPKVNGKALELKEHERARSLAIAPDKRRFALGTDWLLRVYDADGKVLDRVQIPGVAWAVNVTPEGRKVVAGFGDGTLRWYALSRQGKLAELLALYALPDGRWVLWTPSGYYQASAGAEDLIGWHVNSGADTAPDFYGASRFRDTYYRPDVIAKVLDTLDVKEALRLADLERGERTVVADVRATRPPVVRILAPLSGTPVSGTKLTLTYEARSKTAPITAIEARIDGRPAQVLSDHPDYREERRAVIGQMTIEIQAKSGTVSLLARNEHGVSEPADFVVNWTGGKDYYKPDLYVLAVGVSEYDVKGLKLKFGAKDARDFGSAIEGQSDRGLYRNVTTRVLTDDEATHRKILKGLSWLERQTTSRDVAMLFLAGHGIKDQKNNYRFLPQDADLAELKLTTIRDSVFKDFLADVAGKTVMFFDTCFSGDVLKRQGILARADSQADVDKFASELADAEAGVIVFSSSTGRQFSLEKDAWQNGAFTKALVEGIREGKADFTRDLHVSVSELEVYVSDRVKTLTNGRQRPVTTRPKAIEDLDIVRLRAQ